MNAPGKDRWQAVSPLLDEALELAPAEREAFIAALAQRAAPLAQLLARLLDQHDRLLRSDFLETSPALAADGPSLAGRAIGAYTLDAPIGMGGMGAVWRAHRSDGRFEGQVAIKLLNVALLDPAGSARFQREGTILARLTHPHIARLLDAGLWITGQPFLVLEYIAGRPIDAYAAHHRLALPDRLALVQQVIAAVAHAHAHLVVHRDLKPSNILVTPAGDVKLLDFGIAALLDPAAPGAATLPQALTPEFAAPEQVDGQPVSTATDIYALGVLLYRLLTGRHPTGDGCTTAAQYARALADVEPRLASASVQAGDAARAAALAAERGTTPARLARALRGDLDTILATALRKAPAARYASVTALGDDLRRALAHEPVAARPIPWPHRALRAVRRHRVAATAAALVATTLAGATVITARQAADAARQRDAAVASARRAEASSEFLSFLVSQIGNRPMTMREVLDRARVALEKQYTGEPETVARMLVQMSGRYMELHDQPAVLATLTRALEVATPLDRPELHAAINCDIAEWHADNHDTATARRFHAQALAALQRVAQPPTGLLVECLLTEQAIAETDQRFNDAVVPAQRAVALLEAEGNTSSTRYTSALNSLTLTLDNLDRHRESLVLRRRVIDTLERIGRGRTSAMAVSLHNLAFSEVSVGRWLDAVDTYTRVVDIIRGSDATGGMPAIYAVTYGRMLLQAGRDAEAEAWLARGLATVEDADAPIRLRGLSGQFDLALRRGDRAAARALADRLGPLTAALPPASVRDHTMRMARLALLEGDVAAARRFVDAVLSAERYGPGTSSAALYLVLPEAADIVVATGDAATGERYARDAIALAEQACGSDAASAHVGAAHLALARALEAQGRRADAAPHAATALDLLTRSAGAGHPLTRDARTLTAS